MQVAITSWEASGDRVGGQLAGEIRTLRPDAEIWGTGGKYLRAAGADVVLDSTRWGFIGVAAALRVLPRVLLARRTLLRELLRRRPDVLVPIDAGAINLSSYGPLEGLVPWTRKHLPDTRIVYYFPPSSWRHTLRGTTLGNGMTDRVATPFPWSESELRRLGVSADFVGHPLLDLVHPSETFADFAARYGIDTDRPIVGILPGSRAQEIAHILPAQLAAAAIVHKRVPGVQFLLALAPTVDRRDVVRAVERVRRESSHLHDLLRRIEERLREEITGPTPPRTLPALVTTQGTLLPPPRRELEDSLAARTRRQLEQSETARPRDFALTIIEDATYDVMNAADVLIAASGTATLEAAILGRAMVIVYRMSPWNTPQYRLMLRSKSLPKYIGMPNLLADRQIVPEYIQEAATPEAIADETINYLLEPERLLRAREDLRAAVALLGKPGGAARAARIVVETAETKRGGEPPAPPPGI